MRVSASSPELREKGENATATTLAEETEREGCAPGGPGRRRRVREGGRRPGRSLTRRRWPGAVGHGGIVPYGARSPVRRLGAEHAQIPLFDQPIVENDQSAGSGSGYSTPAISGRGGGSMCSSASIRASLRRLRRRRGIQAASTSSVAASQISATFESMASQP